MKHFSIWLCLLLAASLSAQSKLWKGYFSYREIKDLSESPTRLVAASENALCYKDLVGGSVTTRNTIDGLSGETITALHYSPTYKRTLIGYQNGLMIVVNETDGSVLNVVDILNKSISPLIKKVNHFNEYNGIVYVSCDFGIVEYNLATLVFGDTFFIGDNAAQIAVKQTAIFNGRIYAATQYSGIRSADVTNANLNDFAQWTNVAAGDWSGVEVIGTNLMATNTGGSLQRWNGSAFAAFAQLAQPALDLRASDDHLIVTTASNIYLYNVTLGPVRTINTVELSGLNASFTCATLIHDVVYIGTLEDGLQSTTLMPSSFTDLTPDGPLRNRVFAMGVAGANLWTVFGDYSVTYNPYPLDYYGISKFSPQGWKNTTYEELTAAVGKPVLSISRVTVNPVNTNEVYLSSYFSGLLKVVGDTPTLLYDNSNSTLEAYVDGSVRVNGGVYDANNNLWVTNQSIKALKVMAPSGQWQSGYDFSNVFPANLALMGRLSIDKNGTKWFATRESGIVGFNEAYGNLIRTISDDATGNLPISQTLVAAPDARGQLWIGTRKGLRVLSSVDSFLTQEPLATESIIIVEENLAQELLYEQYITDIFVDGANNKWISTSDSGVFYVSANGQQTFHHFTTDNSPLPSNSVNDIDVNGATGEVFIATDKGLVSFKGTSTAPNDNLDNVYVYPNPVRPGYAGTVKISGLTDNANVKVTDVEGNLVYEQVSSGGTIEWDTTAFGKYRVASGVYMVFVSTEDGADTKVKKVMIVR